ncbi:MAG: DUF1549 domain-containing protein [Luteolibacter sp.]
MKLLKLLTLFSILLGSGQSFAVEASKKEGEELRKAALEIDKYIASFYRKKKLPVPNVTDDATFMRRAFLVGIGRIPTAEEALAFLEIEEEGKRRDLVAYLMGSKGYSSHMTNWAFDLLRIRDGRPGTSATNLPYRDWVRRAMTDNMRWDNFTTELLASSGNGWDPERAAVGYYTIDRGMPLDNLANTMRIFLGSQMECAQCHDDFFGETERRDFYHLAAFTENQSQINEDVIQELYSEESKNRYEDKESFQVAKFFRDKIYQMSLGGDGEGRIELPEDYQYRDGDPGELIGARTPFGDSVRMSDRKAEGGGRAEFAEWVVSGTDDQFSGVIANRMWQKIMGKGIYEPVDDYRDPKETVHPELTSYLANLMDQMDYDLNAFQHVLMLTKTFQFATNPNPSVLTEGDDFHGRKIERLTAEQIWDSLITLSAGDPDKKPLRTLDTRVSVSRGSDLGGMNMVELSDEVLEIESAAELRAYFKDFKKKLKKSGGAGGDDSDSMMGMTSKPTTYSQDSPVRASELPSPAPRDHFLYLFGASDREVVEAASLEPNVGQVLSMMNGFVQRELVGKNRAHVYQSLKGASSNEEKIRRIYVAILSRPPTTEEMVWMKEEIESQGENGFSNIVAALVMSSEFLFLQ